MKSVVRYLCENTNSDTYILVRRLHAFRNYLQTKSEHVFIRFEVSRSLLVEKYELRYLYCGAQLTNDPMRLEISYKHVYSF